MSTTRQALRFVCAGTVGVLLYIIILYALTEWLGVWYLLSATIAMLVNNYSNFTFHKRWTFKSKDPNVGRQMIQYGILVAFAFFTNLGVLYVLVEFAHLWYMWAQAISTVILTVISFLVSRRIFAK